MEHSFQIDFAALFLLALSILILPPVWLFSVIVAGGIHEACHYLAACAFKIPCYHIRIGAGGTEMTLGPMNRKQELLVSAAGPAGSFLAAVTYPVFPCLAVCAGVQGLFNLLPIWPLDGGRILHCILWSRTVLCRSMEILTAAAVLLAGFWLCYEWKLGLFPILIAGAMVGRAFLRKIPCNEAKLGVQ